VVDLKKDLLLEVLKTLKNFSVKLATFKRRIKGLAQCSKIRN
jgi:hypothetical protein